MRRYLVVANQTLGGEHLAEKVREYMAAGPCVFHVVVPATPSHEHLTWTEGEARALAAERLERQLERFKELGAEADGEVGDQRPLQAIADALMHETYDEIVISTLPPGVSRWLKRDLVHRAERTFEVPVTHITGDAEPADSQG